MLETSSDYGDIHRHNYHRAILAAADHVLSDGRGPGTGNLDITRHFVEEEKADVNLQLKCGYVNALAAAKEGSHVRCPQIVE